MQNSTRRYASTRETEAYTGIGDLASHRVRGTSPPYSKIGNGRNSKVIYDLDVVDQWLAERRFKNTSQYTVTVADPGETAAHENAGA